MFSFKSKMRRKEMTGRTINVIDVGAKNVVGELVQHAAFLAGCKLRRDRSGYSKNGPEMFINGSLERVLLYL